MNIYSFNILFFLLLFSFNSFSTASKSNAELQLLEKNACKEEKKKLNAAAHFACNQYDKTLNTGECQNKIAECESFKQESESKDYKEYKRLRNTNITKLTDEEKEELKKLDDTFYKKCPWDASIYRAAYLEDYKDIKDNLNTVTDKIDTLNEDIIKKTAKIDTIKTAHATALAKINESSTQKNKAFLKTIENLDEDTKTKIQGEMAKVTTSQKNIIKLKSAYQKIIDKKQKTDLNREEKCHYKALVALRHYQKAKTQSVLNGSNHISFAALIKRSRLTRKQREEKYKKTMYSQCLYNPIIQKKAKLWTKQITRIRKELMQKQKTELTKMQQAQKEINDIAYKKHLKHGKLLEEQNKAVQAFNEEIQIAKTENKNKIKALEEQIILLRKQENYQDTKFTELDTQKTLKKIYEKTKYSADPKKNKSLKKYATAQIAVNAYNKFYNTNNICVSEAEKAEAKKQHNVVAH